MFRVICSFSRCSYPRPNITTQIAAAGTSGVDWIGAVCIKLLDRSQYPCCCRSMPVWTGQEDKRNISSVRNMKDSVRKEYKNTHNSNILSNTRVVPSETQTLAMKCPLLSDLQITAAVSAIARETGRKFTKSSHFAFRMRYVGGIAPVSLHCRSFHTSRRQLDEKATSAAQSPTASKV